MQKLKAACIFIARMLLGATFVFSGFVKAIDPLGTVYKLHDYLEALHLNLLSAEGILLACAIALSTFELAMGVFILLAIGRRQVSKCAVAFMFVMTAITAWIYAYDPVKDCGCFGDAILLTNGETLLKNIVLFACALVIAKWPLEIRRLLSRPNQWIVVQATGIISVALSIWCLYDLPLIDFRPYSVGTDIKAGMTIPDGAEEPEFETTFIMEKDGVRKEFGIDNYPDSTWTFVDSKTVTIKEGYVPPIQDFSITTQEGEDITQQVLGDPNYTFLLISPSLKYADDQNFGTIDQTYEYSQDNEYEFYCLTASSENEISHWKDITGAEYSFCHTDGTTLKTIIRSNPGLLLLKNGIVIGKWSHNRLPDADELDRMTKNVRPNSK